jgi:hypothetical protein
LIAVASCRTLRQRRWCRSLPGTEQQRIMKMGGRITKVELASGVPQRNVGNT